MGILNQRPYLPKTKYEKGFLYAEDKIHYLEFLKTAGDLKCKIEEKNENIDPYKVYKEAFSAFEKNEFFFANKKFEEAELNFLIANMQPKHL